MDSVHPCLFSVLEMGECVCCVTHNSKHGFLLVWGVFLGGDVFG